jgi:hypothetical protein
MPSTPALDRLRAIKSLPQLAAYLRDELDWPIESDDVENISFDYTAAELGLNPEYSDIIKEIKQLRPLAGNQPWGIFFVNFQKKHLPVVIMRQILRTLVFKKRQSANKADRQAWQPHDLLFISAYGEDTDRAITLAHFVEQATTGLAELRVLGWDDDDTPLHMDYVVRVMQEQLHWDSQLVKDPEAWRARWSKAFVLRHRHVVRTSEELAEELATLAKRIRARIRTILRMEDGFGEMRKLQRAFQKCLIHDLDDEGFADMFAQTVTYGLFSVSVRRTFPGEGTAVSKDDVPNLIFTSPFLKDMLGVFLGLKSRKGKIDFDDLGISDITDFLTSPDTHIEVVLADFNNKTRGEDPVIHFYEHFLEAYNKKQKIQRGVFYTPQPVVSYIVRNVHELLQTEFGLADGLADITTWGEMVKKHPGLKLPPQTDEHNEKETISPDEPFVQILDPATGTATFIVEVIEVIYSTLTAKWKERGRSELEIQKLWNDYVPKHLLPRVHAFELMMAPYAIAHMKVGLKLAETGYLFGSEERARIYLTNALEPKVKQLPSYGFEALAEEAEAVNNIKWYKRFTVVIGNPPYSSLSQNMSEWARGIVDFYFHDETGRMSERGNRNQLQDDYVKFFRFGQLAINVAGTGVLGYISNSSYTRGPWFRGMRYQLMQEFDSISILDLHGSQAHTLDSTEGDQNVFEITTPVAIDIMRRHLPKRIKKHTVAYSDIHGSRNTKYERLAEVSATNESQVALTPSKENQWRFVPHDNTNQEEWAKYIPIPEMFVNWGAGVLTNRNGLAVAETRNDVLKKARRFADLTISDAEIEAEYGFSSNYQWTTGKARKEFSKSPVQDLATPYTFRPFDFLFIYWHRNLVYNMRGDKMEVFRNDPHQIALMFSRNTKHPAYTNIYVTNRIADRHCLEEANVAPLYTSADSESLFAGHATERSCNLSKSFVSAFKANLNTEGSALSPEDIFHYAYGVFHSPGYRSRYAEFLKIDFPRLPLTGNLELFRALARLGGELTALHLLESPTLDKPITEYIGGRSPVVEKPTWDKKTVWLDKAQTIGFKGVREDVWNFHIGGYQVCEKWLKDRKGRNLSADDRNHYQKIIVALSETIRLMKEIDAVIETHGGWPLK